jgi:hypothetical protein
VLATLDQVAEKIGSISFGGVDCKKIVPRPPNDPDRTPSREM